MEIEDLKNNTLYAYINENSCNENVVSFVTLDDALEHNSLFAIDTLKGCNLTDIKRKIDLYKSVLSIVKMKDGFNFSTRFFIKSDYALYDEKDLVTAIDLVGSFSGQTPLPKAFSGKKQCY